MTPEDLIRHIDQLIQSGKKVLSTTAGERKGIQFVDASMLRGFRSASLSFITATYGDSHTYFKEFYSNTNVNSPGSAKTGIAILESIRTEVENGWLYKIKELVEAEFFADFLEMASHLLENHYKDASAVIAGSVLEEKLRLLCTKNGIDTSEIKDGKSIPKKSERLNESLAKADIYTKLQQKQITAWLAIRNSAAHGDYSDYSISDVKNFINGLTDFSIKHFT